MTRTFLSEFLDRKREVRSYFRMLVRAEREASGIHRLELETRRINVVKAGAFLILYNLVEASARGAVEAIHEAIVGRSVRFEELVESVRGEVIRGFKKSADVEQHLGMRDLDVAIVRASLSAEMRFSGNVDAKVIRKIGQVYGFDISSPRGSRSGVDLVSIKSNRNDLAHGLKSFEMVGRQYTARELLAIAIRSIIYLESFLNSVDAYLSCEGYLSSGPPSPLRCANE